MVISSGGGGGTSVLPKYGIAQVSMPNIMSPVMVQLGVDRIV